MYLSIELCVSFTSFAFWSHHHFKTFLLLYFSSLYICEIEINKYQVFLSIKYYFGRFLISFPIFNEKTVHQKIKLIFYEL